MTPLTTAVLRGATAGAAGTTALNAATDVPTAAMRVINPARWSTKDWLSDARPHLVYGTVTYARLRLLDDR
jgi:hypothetical protein